MPVTAWILIRESGPASLPEGPIQAEATEGSAQHQHERTRIGSPTATAPDLGCCRPDRRPSSCYGSPSSQGSFFWSSLEPRRRTMGAVRGGDGDRVHGRLDPRRDDLVRALWASTPDQQVRGVPDLRQPRRNRWARSAAGPRRHRVPAPTHATHSTSANATVVVSIAVVVATGIAADGSREVLGLERRRQRRTDTWRSFLVALKQRGLHGVRPSDLRPALRAGQALKRSFPGACVSSAGSTSPAPARARAQVPHRHGRRRCSARSSPDAEAVSTAWDEVATSS